MIIFYYKFLLMNIQLHIAFYGPLTNIYFISSLPVCTPHTRYRPQPTRILYIDGNTVSNILLHTGILSIVFEPTDIRLDLRKK